MIEMSDIPFLPEYSGMDRREILMRVSAALENMRKMENLLEFEIPRTVDRDSDGARLMQNHYLYEVRFVRWDMEKVMDLSKRPFGYSHPEDEQETLLMVARTETLLRELKEHTVGRGPWSKQWQDFIAILPDAPPEPVGPMETWTYTITYQDGKAVCCTPPRKLFSE